MKSYGYSIFFLIAICMYMQRTAFGSTIKDNDSEYTTSTMFKTNTTSIHAPNAESELGKQNNNSVTLSLNIVADDDFDSYVQILIAVAGVVAFIIFVAFKMRGDDYGQWEREQQYKFKIQMMEANTTERRKSSAAARGGVSMGGMSQPRPSTSGASGGYKAKIGL